MHQNITKAPQKHTIAHLSKLLFNNADSSYGLKLSFKKVNSILFNHSLKLFVAQPSYSSGLGALRVPTKVITD